MRRSLTIVTVMLSVAMLVTGCDFFRVLADRPTSKAIAAKRERILRSARQAQESARQDTVAVRSDTVSVRNETVAVPSRPAGSQTGTKTVEKKRYYVIMGAFSSRENAERYAERIKGYGYEPEFFGFTGGRTAVGIGGTDDHEEAKEFMKELKGQDFCPGGVWILDRKRK